MNRFGEPWAADVKSDGSIYIVSNGDDHILAANPSAAPDDEYILRLIECVNALAGVDNPAAFVANARSQMQEKERDDA